MAKGKKGKRKSRKGGRKVKLFGKRRGGGRGRKGGIPMPEVSTLAGAAALVGMDVVDASVFNLPDDIHPWAAGLFIVGYAKKSPEIIQAAYMVELAHESRQHGITKEIVAKAASMTGKLTGSDQDSGGGALKPGDLIDIQNSSGATIK